LVVAQLAVIFYLVLLLRMNPYLRRSDDVFHALTQIEIYLLLLVAYIFESMPADEAYSSQDDWIISIALILITVLVFVGFTLHFSKIIINNIRQYWTTYNKRRRRTKEKEKENKRKTKMRDQPLKEKADTEGVKGQSSNIHHAAEGAMPVSTQGAGGEIEMQGTKKVTTVMPMAGSGAHKDAHHHHHHHHGRRGRKHRADVGEYSEEGVSGSRSGNSSPSHSDSSSVSNSASYTYDSDSDSDSASASASASDSVQRSVATPHHHAHAHTHDHDHAHAHAHDHPHPPASQFALNPPTRANYHPRMAHRQLPPLKPPASVSANDSASAQQQQQQQPQQQPQPQQQHQATPLSISPRPNPSFSSPWSLRPLRPLQLSPSPPAQGTSQTGVLSPPANPNNPNPNPRGRLRQTTGPRD